MIEDNTESNGKVHFHTYSLNMIPVSKLFKLQFKRNIENTHLLNFYLFSCFFFWNFEWNIFNLIIIYSWTNLHLSNKYYLALIFQVLEHIGKHFDKTNETVGNQNVTKIHLAKVDKTVKIWLVKIWKIWWFDT